MKTEDRGFDPHPDRRFLNHICDALQGKVHKPGKSDFAGERKNEKIDEISVFRFSTGIDRTTLQEHVTKI
jgi:hypothetical protein